MKWVTLVIVYDIVAIKNRKKALVIENKQVSVEILKS